MVLSRLLHRSVRVPVSTALLVLLVSMTGCFDNRPKRVTVAGKVLIDGAPLPKGNVIFVPEGGRPSTGKIGDEGRFELRCYDEDDGALLGVHRVAVSAKDIISENNVKWYAPRRYSDFKTSGLTVEITESIDDLVLELTSEP